MAAAVDADVGVAIAVGVDVAAAVSVSLPRPHQGPCNTGDLAAEKREWKPTRKQLLGQDQQLNLPRHLRHHQRPNHHQPWNQPRSNEGRNLAGIFPRQGRRENKHTVNLRPRAKSPR